MDLLSYLSFWVCQYCIFLVSENLFRNGLFSLWTLKGLSNSSLIFCRFDFKSKSELRLIQFKFMNRKSILVKPHSSWFVYFRVSELCLLLLTTDTTFPYLLKIFTTQQQNISKSGKATNEITSQSNYFPIKLNRTMDFK